MIRKIKPLTPTCDQICQLLPKDIRGRYGDRIKTMVFGYQNPIRAIRLVGEVERIRVGESYRCVYSAEEKQNLLISMTITAIARSNGARNDIPGDVLTSCRDYILLECKGLGLKELSIAFHLANSAKLNVDNNMYGGVFHVGYLGKVLTAYKEYRKPLLHALLDIKNHLSTCEKDKSFNIMQLNLASYRKTVDDIIAAYIGFVKLGSHELIRVHHYNLLHKLGVLRLKKQTKDIYMLLADDYVKHEIRLASQGNPVLWRRPRLEQVIDGIPEEKRIVWAKKLCVMTLFGICRKNNFEAETFKMELLELIAEMENTV